MKDKEKKMLKILRLIEELKVYIMQVILDE